MVLSEDPSESLCVRITASLMFGEQLEIIPVKKQGGGFLDWQRKAWGILFMYLKNKCVVFLLKIQQGNTRQRIQPSSKPLSW